MKKKCSDVRSISASGPCNTRDSAIQNQIRTGHGSASGPVAVPAVTSVASAACTASHVSVLCPCAVDVRQGQGLELTSTFFTIW